MRRIQFLVICLFLLVGIQFSVGGDAEQKSDGLVWRRTWNEGMATAKKHAWVLLGVLTPAHLEGQDEATAASLPDLSLPHDLRAVAVRLPQGGSPSASAVRTLYDSWDEELGIVALSPDGMLLGRDFPLGGAAFVQAIRGCYEEWAAWKEQGTSSVSSARAQRVQIALLKRRFQWRACQEACLRFLARNPDAIEVRETLVSSYTHQGLDKKAAAALGWMIREYPQHPKALSWRLQLATTGLQQASPLRDQLDTDAGHQSIGRLRSLVDETVAMGDLHKESWLRAALCNGLTVTRAQEVAQYEWLFKFSLFGNQRVSACNMILFHYHEIDPGYAVQCAHRLLRSYPTRADIRKHVEDFLSEMGNEKSLAMPFPTSMAIEPSSPRVGDPIRIAVRVENPSERWVRVQVLLDPQGIEVEPSCSLETSFDFDPGATNEVEFAVTARQAGILELLADVHVAGAPAGRYHWFRTTVRR